MRRKVLSVFVFGFFLWGQLSGILILRDLSVATCGSPFEFWVTFLEVYGLSAPFQPWQAVLEPWATDWLVAC